MRCGDRGRRSRLARMSASTAPSPSASLPPLPEAPLSYRLARRVTEYARLMRLDRPVGTWLLLWPALWALWIAGSGRPRPQVLGVFVLGVVVMRAAGCVINDFLARNIDPHVQRTRDRPLAARRVSPLEALLLFALLLAVALYLVTRLDLLTVQLAAFGGWSVPMAFAAQTGALPRVAWVLYIAAVIWASVYDTLYAMVDREDDLEIGVKSSALLFADMDRLLIGVMQAMMLGALALVGRNLHFGAPYQGGLAAAGVLFLWQQWLIRKRDPAACMRAFLNNQYVGLVVFVGILLQFVYA